jgi:iron complex transport system substrate-binding protein
VRIATLVPSATDLVCALGLEEQLVRVSHEWEHPATRGRPGLTRSTVPGAPEAVDRAVGEAVAAGRSLYTADRPARRAPPRCGTRTSASTSAR